MAKRVTTCAIIVVVMAVTTAAVPILNPLANAQQTPQEIRGSGADRRQSGGAFDEPPWLEDADRRAFTGVLCFFCLGFGGFGVFGVLEKTGTFRIMKML